MNNIAIITARGGSKRIPRKNIKEFCGKPIITYSIKAALSSGLFNEVMVSTDDAEIAELSVHEGAKVPFFRSAKTSDDYATTADVLNEVLERYRMMNIYFDTMCCIYPTAPFITPEKLLQAFDLMRLHNADAVTPIVQYSFPPQRAFLINNGCLEYQYPEYASKRSQDLEKIYHDAGQFYFYNVKAFLDKKVYKTVPLILSDLDVQDIDTLDDWNIAEIKFRLKQQSR